MYQDIAKLIVYRDLKDGNILYRLSEIIYAFEHDENISKEQLITNIYQEIHELLQLATEYGFNDNLWQNYLAYLLAVNENPFSMTSEKVGANEGSVNTFVKNDLSIFYRLFHFDFTPMEEALGTNCFQTITNYCAITKAERRYNKSVSDKVRELSGHLAEAKDEEEMFLIVTEFYKNYGVGKFGLNKAFRIRTEQEKVLIYPITNTEYVKLDDLVGYELQKKKLIDNTEAFVEGRKCNNVLLFGASGTGKSTSIKAVLNEYYDRGLRMIEIYKHQFGDLSNIIDQVKDRNYRFVIYMDDLSFEEFEVEYKFLKAVIEGGLETKPDNVLIYATSNRRHLIRETWGDRSDMSNDELHHSDTMQEKLSLAARFGITINYSKPDQKEFFNIVINLARRHENIKLSDEELCREANRWEMSHGGISGRTAQQFINYLAGQA